MPKGATMVGDAVQAVRAILPLIDRCRDEADASARMAPEVVVAAHEAGVFRLFAPADCGAPLVTFPEIMQIFEDLGWADPTVAWHAGNSAAIAFVAASLPDDVRRAPFDGTVGPFGFSVVQGGTLTPADGGYVLAGRWPFLTGALDAPWAAINAVVQSEDPVPDVRLCLVPRQSWTVEHTWQDAVAMRGTGSHAISIASALVPDAFAHSWGRPRVVDAAVHRLPSTVTGPVTNSAICVGIARRSIDEVTTLMANKVSRADGLAVRDKLRMQRELSAAVCEVAILHAGLQDMACRVWESALEGRPPASVRGQMWGTAYLTIDRCRELVGRLAMVGTSALYSRRNPVETALRDVHAIAAAMETFRDLQEAHGRVLLGLKPGMPMF
jgi:alkylation response protein AidB-like acyl-CoA dehydrogenase